MTDNTPQEERKEIEKAFDLYDEILEEASFHEQAAKDHIGDFIRERRNKMGLSLRKVAGSMEISAMHLSDIERGNKSPSWILRKKIINYFK